MAEEVTDVREAFGLKRWKIILPIVIGLGVTVWMFDREYEPGMFGVMQFTGLTILWWLLAACMMLMRDVGYMIRIRILADGDLSWAQAFKIIMLWEFSSAVTPSAVGGTSVAVFFVNRELKNIGRSTGIVMVTSFLDELFFAIVFPLVVLLIGYDNIFGGNPTLAHFAFIGYGLKVAFILVLFYGFFINPRGLKWLLLLIFKLPYLRRWRAKANAVGDDIIATSKVFKEWNRMKWLRAFGATCASWISRYWVANALVVAFFGASQLGLFDHLVVFGKQLAMWIMMLVAPTPGGAGFAEYVFKEFLGAFVPAGGVVPLALAWRMVSYYPYLIVGVILLPKWLGDIKVKKNKTDRIETSDEI